MLRIFISKRFRTLRRLLGLSTTRELSPTEFTVDYDRGVITFSKPPIKGRALTVDAPYAPDRVRAS